MHPSRRLLAIIFASVIIFWISGNEKIEQYNHIKKEVINRHIRNINHDSDDTIRISFQIHDGNVLPFGNRFVPECTLGGDNYGVRGKSMPPQLWAGGLFMDNSRNHAHRGVLDIGTTISTNLNILHIGDSVSLQIAGAMDEMLGAYDLQSRNSIELKAARKSQYFGTESAGITVAPTRGGGAHFTWRVVKLLSESLQDESRPGFHGAWQTDMAKAFLNLTYQWKGGNIAVRHMDAVVFRATHGWMSIGEITRERIIESAELAHSLFGADTIIFLTVPFSNNVKTVLDLESVKRINSMIREIADTWHDHHDTNMLILDYAKYCDHIIWTNARHIGYNVSAPLAANQSVFHEEAPHFLLDRLLQKKDWPPSIPMVCAKLPTNDSGGVYCDQNLLFKDGIHICPETLAARIGIGIECLLGCIYNKVSTDDYTQSTNSSDMSTIRSCELQCNALFMSVVPVQESWINSTLASFS